MAARVQQLDIKIGGDSAGGVQALDQTEKKVESLGQKMKAFMAERRATGEAATARVFGGSGERALEYLFGGGAKLAITAFAMRELANMTENAVQHMEKLRAGTESVGDALMGIAKGIPLIGEAIKAGEGLGKLIRLGFGFEDPEEVLKEAEATAKKVEERLEYFRKQGTKHTLAALEGVDRKKKELELDSEHEASENNKRRIDELAELAKKDAKARKEIADNNRSYAGTAGMGAGETADSARMRLEKITAEELALTRETAEAKQKIIDKYAKEEVRIKDDAQREVGRITTEHDREMAKRLKDEQDKAVEEWEAGEKKIAEANRHHWDELERQAAEFVKRRSETSRKLFEEILAASHDQASVDGRLAGFKIESAMEKGNQLEAERLKVAEEYRQKREEILRILQDENATAAQKVRASRLGDELDARERKALGRINAGISNATGFGFESAQFLTGVRGSNNAGDKLADVAKNTEPVPEKLQLIADKIDQWLKAFSAKPTKVYSGN